ncbi:MAG: tRNA 2-thiocytidine(32) synthetase TtcA [Xanthomonadales bacterium]|nr:tRNA 2-thiocytidine(32) synthetase TtcA [Xanthomonadales bacterium]
MTAPKVDDSEINADRLARQLRRQVGQAIADYRMIDDGDRILVCVSGGKDSWVMLDMLRELQARAPIRFELMAVHLDQKQPGYDATILPDALRIRGIPFHIIEQDTYSVVQRIIPAGATMCSLCSRLRRGALYEFAAGNGYNRIALGHHRDDIVETLFLNLFHQARLKAMPPKLRADDGRNIVIRPLAYCAESDIAEFARQRAYPIIPCDLCGSQETLQRKAVKRMLQAWEAETPGRVENIFRALTRIDPSQLADPVLFDFSALGVSPPDAYPEPPARPLDA